MLRGGSWNNNPENLRSANRNNNTPTNRNNNIGFRIARTAHAGVSRFTERFSVHGSSPGAARQAQQATPALACKGGGGGVFQAVVFCPALHKDCAEGGGVAILRSKSGVLSITVRWAIVPPGLPDLTGCE